jgi:hypothetical protein
VTGCSRAVQEDGVFGLNCAGGNGVHGQSATGVGVRGDSDSFLGVFGRSAKGDGIQGRSAAPDHAGVSAVNEGRGFGLWATSEGGGEAGHFEGGVNINGSLKVSGDTTLTGNLSAPNSTLTCFDVSISGGDCAEEFNVTNSEAVEPGTVLSLDADGVLCTSRRAYDKKVAGVVSGGGEYKPGIVLDKQQSSSKRAPVALVGKVCCKVDASYSPIEVGDLLTTSSTPGYAMKAEDSVRAFGAVIGKTLRPLTNGRGVIPILVALQ